jgi:hypothetical protein
MSRKVFLDWEDVNDFWDQLNVNWEDVYILMPGGGTQYYRDNPWDKPWNKPEWRSLSEEERMEITRRYNSKF